ncbi:MAG: sigma-70 family RNA polymerase sigma factor [Oscillospiraceae bacterium]|nr:sigma-70 family RNA polymerase sigma factor [Oscillospiraceae bacterium]
MNDSEIVDLYWQRSEQAITETARKYGAYCRRIAYNILANDEDAEECVSDTYMSAWNAMPDARPKRLNAFLAKITRNFALRRIVRHTAKKRGGGETVLALEELTDCIASGYDLERELEQKELAAAIDRFVGRLPEREQLAFIGRYWFFATERELAARLGCSRSGVGAMLKRTRGALREYLIEEGLCTLQND